MTPFTFTEVLRLLMESDKFTHALQHSATQILDFNVKEKEWFIVYFFLCAYVFATAHTEKAWSIFLFLNCLRVCSLYCLAFGAVSCKEMLVQGVFFPPYLFRGDKTEIYRPRTTSATLHPYKREGVTSTCGLREAHCAFWPSPHPALANKGITHWVLIWKSASVSFFFLSFLFFFLIELNRDTKPDWLTADAV